MHARLGKYLLLALPLLVTSCVYSRITIPLDEDVETLRIVCDQKLRGEVHLERITEEDE